MKGVPSSQDTKTQACKTLSAEVDFLKIGKHDICCQVLPTDQLLLLHPGIFQVRVQLNFWTNKRFSHSAVTSFTTSLDRDPDLDWSIVQILKSNITASVSIHTFNPSYSTSWYKMVGKMAFIG